MIEFLVSINTWLCDQIQRRLPWRLTRSLFLLQERTIATILNAGVPRRILDVGSGRASPFVAYRSANSRAVIIGLDIVHQRLKQNVHVDCKLVSDATQSMALQDSSVDVIVTRSVLEHLADTRGFFAECRRVLRPRGVCIHVFPGRYSPFALFNRILPRRVTRRLIEACCGDAKHELGFPAFYRDCYYPRIATVLRQSGFELETISCRYYQASYYRGCLPVYALFVLYDSVLWLLNLRLLCAQLLIVARKLP